MTPEQRKMARHALGLPNERNATYRNRYFAAAGTSKEDAWNDLVAQGLAERGDGIRNIGFGLTVAGARMVLEPPEFLCHEDFPSSVPRPASNSEAK